MTYIRPRTHPRSRTVNENQQRWAVFWCSLLHDVLFGQIQPNEVQAYLKRLARKERRWPNGAVKKPSLATLKRKLKAYREGGFEALARKPRGDRGKPRATTAEVIADAVEIKKDQARRSHKTINRFLDQKHATTVKRSTLYRHLKAAGATRIKLGVTQKPVRKRWTREHTHELWVGDFEEGPYVRVEDEVLPTHLSAFIDAHSRFVVEARYYLRQNLDILIDSLLRAWATHGASRALYVDNAKVYHAKALKAACYRLHIEPLYRKPKDPAGGGVIERFFETAQDQFEAEVRAGDLLTLPQLNRAFSAWLNVSYHDEVHSETKQTPRMRYQKGWTVMRHVDLQRAQESFLRSEKRKVDRDFSDVRLGNRFYRVDPRLRGDWVRVRYDPFSDMQSVQIHALDDVYLGKGLLHAREQGARPETVAQGKPKYDYLALLIEQHEKQLAAEAKGIDYRKIGTARRWPFAAFVCCFARLLGKRRGLGAFTAGELETLKKIYNRNAALDEGLLKEAFERAHVKSPAHVGRQLQSLASRKERE